MCPKEGFKDWVYHAYNNRNRVPSKQGYLIFTTKVDALQWFKERIQREITFLNKRKTGALLQLRETERLIAKEATQYTSIMEEVLTNKLSYEEFSRLWMGGVAPITFTDRIQDSNSSNSNYLAW